MLRLIVVIFVVLIATIIGQIVLTIVGPWGLLILAAIVPDRINVSGCVTDSSGKAMKGVEVRAIPLEVEIPGLGGYALNTGSSEHKTVTGRNGRYKFRRMIGGRGVKESAWVQKYDIVVKAESHAPQRTTVGKKWRSDGVRKITGIDFVLDEDSRSPGRR